MNSVRRVAAGALGVLLTSGLGACVTQEQKSKAAIENFKQNAAGQYRSANGAELFIVPVRARMVTDEAMYVERRDASTTFGRLINLELAEDGKKIVQRALAFTQDGQWRDLQENPE